MGDAHPTRSDRDWPVVRGLDRWAMLTLRDPTVLSGQTFEAPLDSLDRGSKIRDSCHPSLGGWRKEVTQSDDHSAKSNQTEPNREVPRLNIRPARVGDVPAIYELIRTFAERRQMIRR